MERPAFSDMLAIRRRELGYSIRQASRVLRLREDVLIAFEEGNFEQMPKSGYAQGMLSSYARYLGLDANEVVGAFTVDLERYNREMRHRRRDADINPRGYSGGRTNQYGDRVSQPYVRSRGLLPTSGGVAGDMGSFSTTRVRPRTFDTSSEVDEEAPQEQRAATGYESTYVQSRPYTARTPRVTSRNHAGNTQIRVQNVDMFDYADDLNLTNDARNFEAASTGVGRRSSRHISDVSRPRVERRSEGAGRSQRRGAQRGRGGSQRPSSSIMPSNMVMMGIAVAVVIVITVVIIMSVSSCVRQGTEARTVPVSAAMEEQNKAQESASQPQPTDAAAQTTEPTAATGAETPETEASDSASTSARETETSVSVSVAAGAVTWLDIVCDGVSDVATTVTGPWQHTYTVEDSITVQTDDTTSVSVVQNGRQVQFDSITAGVGTLRIEGTKKSKPSGSEASSKENTSSSTSTNRIGDNAPQSNQGDAATGEAAAAATATPDAQASAAAQQTAPQGTDTDYSGGDGGYADSGYGYDDSGYGYDDSGYGYDDTSYGYDDTGYGYDEYTDDTGYGYGYGEEYDYGYEGQDEYY